MSGAFTDYCAIPAINWSRLRHLHDSPLHYRWHSDHPTPDTPAMARGRLVHCAALEPDELPLRYAVWDSGRKQGKAWAEFCSVNESREVVSVAEYETACQIRDAVRSHPIAGPLLTGGMAEQTLTWTDPETHLSCKCRLDYISDKAVVDLKTTGSVEAREFGKTVERYCYHGQAAFYMSGVEATCGYQVPPPFVFIAVESDPPHDVAVFTVSEDDLFLGETIVQDLMRRVVECTATGQWPGRYSQAKPLLLPAWAWPPDEEWAETIRRNGGK